MDAKNDDSAGSDSLDKSLQKKCVVDDVGQGEGASTTQQSGSDSIDKKSTLTRAADEQVRPGNSTKKQKTEKSMGDGGGSIEEIAATKIKAQQTPDDKTPKSAIECENHANPETPKLAHNNANNINTSSNSIEGETPSNIMPNNRNAFETKVKQISKNLKETTLAENANKNASLVDSNCSSSSTSSTSSCEYDEAATPSCSSAVTLLTTDVSQAVPADTEDATPDLDCSLASSATANESFDAQDQRSKKVRFHPDVKENDGGNRVLKKKKKLKNNPTADEPSTSQAAQQNARSSADEMELDEEDDYEEEDEFDMEKTIAEAKDYLKDHPLTFVRTHEKEKTGERLRDGLLEAEDFPQTQESDEEEDFYEQVLPENGVERILGKLTKGRKVEYLLRYAGRNELGWESEEFITKFCPNMLNKYEEYREWRQSRLMRHVAKRQTMRQRYTDF